MLIVLVVLMEAISFGHDNNAFFGHSETSRPVVVEVDADFSAFGDVNIFVDDGVVDMAVATNVNVIKHH